MHTHSARLGALVSTLVICLGIGSTFNYVTSFGWAMNPSGEIGSPKVYSLGTSKELNSDRAILQFSLDADLTSAFQWNTKQLFVYVTAEYEVIHRIVHPLSTVPYTPDAQEWSQFRCYLGPNHTE
eukprot:GHVO01065200.1.p1 GENE.GHVO01065200.1~~GHVO01065200.1.p1  ORF type:complete len:125 (+),score=8.80 GHVO01065200.1:23-397(+)